MILEPVEKSTSTAKRCERLQKAPKRKKSLDSERNMLKDVLSISCVRTSDRKKILKTSMILKRSLQSL